MNTMTRQPVRQAPSLSMLLIGAGFAIIVIAYVTYLRPEMQVNQEFAEATCEIIEKRLISAENRSGVVYRPEFHIRYHVDGVQYDALTYDITLASVTSRSVQEEVLDRFEVGQTYPCWHDAANPQIVVLVRGYSAFGFILVGLGGLLLVIGLVGMI